MAALQAAREALAQRDFQRLDDLWTEMVLDTTIPLDDFFAITTELKKAHESAHALLLLEMLASHLESNNEYHKAIDVYKNMLYHTKDSTEIREKLIALYKNANPQSKHLNEYIAISELKTSESIFKAIEKLDEFLKYDTGRYFYFERYGIGEVIEVLPSRREVVIDFEKKKRHFLTISVARGLLTPIHRTHFLYMKHRDVAALKDMAETNPVGLIKLMLKSFDEPLNASNIKEYLTGIVEKQQLTKFWERVRKRLANENDIEISGRTLKTYTYHDSAIDKIEMGVTAFTKASEKEKYLLAEEYAKKMPAVFEKIAPELVDIGNRVYKQKPALALDILMLCDDVHIGAQFSYTVDTILEQANLEHLVPRLNNVEHQKSLIGVIREKNEKEWPQILRKLLFASSNAKLLDALEEHLRDIPDVLQDVYYTIFSLSKHYPQQFQWTLKKMQAGELQEYLSTRFIPRLIESLDYVKGIKGMISKILSLETFDTLMKDAPEDDARRILDTINKSETLDDYKKRDFLKIIQFHFPHFFAKETDVIYATEESLKRKKNELDQIISVEIPENKKEISRAREFGDLSENFEYKAAKERQDQLYHKLKTLESELTRTRRIDSSKANTKHVTIGTKITLKNQQDGTLTHYTILGRWDTDLEKNIISNEAPVAQSLLKKVRGDEVIIDKVTYEIVEIEKAVL